MPNHAQAKKRVRQNHTRRLRNRYKLVKARNLMKSLLASENKAEAEKMLPDVLSAVDKLAKSNIIHANKAARHKSQLVRHVNTLA